MKMEEIIKNPTYKSDFSNTSHKVVHLLCVYVFTFQNSPYFFVNVTIIPVHFYYFIFCFIFYYPIVDVIVNHLYVLFLRFRKSNKKCCSKNEINPQRYDLGVASKICG